MANCNRFRTKCKSGSTNVMPCCFNAEKFVTARLFVAF